MDIAVVNAAANVTLSADGSKFESARIAVGAVAPTPLFVKAAGDALAGKPVSAETIERRGGGRGRGREADHGHARFRRAAHAPGRAC